MKLFTLQDKKKVMICCFWDAENTIKNSEYVEVMF